MRLLPAVGQALWAFGMNGESCLQIYLQRLGIDFSDGVAVRCAAGCAFALATQALAELPTLQYPPSLTAAAVLVAARKAQVPFLS